jgi:hypothetical protein
MIPAMTRNSVDADDSERLAGLDRQRDVVQRIDRLRPRRPRAHDPLLQRGNALGRVADADACDLDAVHEVNSERSEE